MRRYLTARDNPVLLMAVLLVFWGSFAAVGKLALSHIDGFQMQFIVFAAAALVMSAQMAVSGKMRLLLRTPPKELVKLAAIGIPQFLYYFLYASSLKLLPAVEASMLNYLFPVFVVLIAVPVNGERMTALKLVSLCVCFAGVVLLVTKGSFADIRLTSLHGDVMALGAALSWGLFSNLGKRNPADQQISCYVYTLTSLLLSAIALFAFSKPILPAWGALLGCIWISLSNVVLTYAIWFRVLKAADSSLAANLSFFTPFVTLLFIAVLLKESIAAVQWIGLLVILLGNLLQSGLIDKRRARPGQTPKIN